MNVESEKHTDIVANFSRFIKNASGKVGEFPADFFVMLLETGRHAQQLHSLTALSPPQQLSVTGFTSIF